MMNNLTVNIYTNINQFPHGLNEEHVFHSPQFFRLAKETPHHKPYMVTAETPDGTIVAQMLALVRYRSSLFPPYLYRHCLILGNGVYRDADSEDAEQKKDISRAEIFGIMLNKLTSKIGRWTLYLEVSNLPSKMYAYKQLRENHYFPVHWMSIHNSLHSKTPEERISERLIKKINAAYARGVVTNEVSSESDFKAFMKLLRQHNLFKPKRFIPDEEFFKGIRSNGSGRLFVTRYHNHIIGCACVIYSNRQAYLWYAAFRRKSYAFVRPDIMTIWHTLKDAHQRGYEHMYLIAKEFSKLSGGGKPTSTYRWFHCSIGWVNKLLEKYF